MIRDRVYRNLMDNDYYDSEGTISKDATPLKVSHKPDTLFYLLSLIYRYFENCLLN